MQRSTSWLTSYLRDHSNSKMAFDPSYPEINFSEFKDNDWDEFYKGVEEAVQRMLRGPLGKDVDLRMLVDSDHVEKRYRPNPELDIS